jgi:hypothetical protein
MLNETMHPEAEELTNLLFALGDQPEEERAYDVLENYVSARSDEAKADLYALIAEAPLAKAGRVDATQLVSRALWLNHKHYPRG